MVMDYGIGFTWDDNLTHNTLLAAAEEAQAIARAAEDAAEEARLASEQANNAARQLAEAVAEVRALAVHAGESADNAGQTAEEALSTANDAASAAAQNATDIAAVDNALDAHIADKAAGVHGAATAATANTIAMRGTGGTLNVGAPTAAAHAATKAYVDAADSAMLEVANAAAQAAESAALTAVWTNITDKPSTYPPSAHMHGNATITDIDASKIISGTIDIARLPAGALDRLKIVSTDAARYALTKADVQTGDTVQVTDTKIMYRVVDDSKLSTAAGYVEYTAARASAVPWSGVTDKPSDFAPAKHAAMHKTGGTDALAPADIGAASDSHTTPVATASATGHVKPGTGASVDAAGALSILYGTAAGTACQGNDSRLTSARTPTAHAATHATGGTDALAPADIGAQSNLGATALGGTPSTQAFGDAADAGNSTAVARANHKHKMPAAPTVSSLGAAPANATLTDAAAGNALPATTSSTLAALLQATRNCLKWLVARFDSAGKALTAVSADKATALANGRYIHISGAVTGSSALFDGTGPATINATAIDVSKANAGLLPIARGGTNAGTAAAACANIGAVKVAGDTMTGNLGMNSSSLIQFDNTTTNPKINLYSTSYAMGIQSSTFYMRTAGVFRFYKGGAHQTGAGAGTGGAEILTVDSGSAVFSGAIQAAGSITSVNAAATSKSYMSTTAACTPYLVVRNELATGQQHPYIRFQATRADGTPQSTATYIQALCDLVNNPVKDTASDSALMIRAGGMLYCGSGESASSVRGAASGATAIPAGWALFTAKVFDDSEHAFLASDQNLYFISAAQTIANSKMLRFATDGHLLPGQNNAQDLGASTYKYRNVHGTTFQGNALTATKLAAAKTISLTGAVTGSVSTDLAGNVSIATTGNTAGLGFTQSLAANGYAKLPNGLILQWGEYKMSPSGHAWIDITFPIAFPKACLGVYPATYQGPVATESGVQISSWTKTLVTVFIQIYVDGAYGPPGFCWFAVGH